MNHYLKGNVQVNLDYGTWFHDGDTVVYGSRASEDIMVAAAELTLYAGAGDDIITLHAFSTNDVIYGEAGNDFIGTTVNTRNPTIYGGAGKDTIRTITDRTYADGGDGDDLFIPLSSAENVTLAGGEGNDTFWFIESSSVSISGGSGNNLYRFDPYYLFGPYHNDVTITDLSSNDTIRLDEYTSDCSGLTWREENGHIVLEDGEFREFTIILPNVTDIYQIADVTYRTTDQTATLREIFELGEGDSTLKTGTQYADNITNTLDGAMIQALGGNDSITNSGSNVSISGGDGADTINNGGYTRRGGDNVTMSGGAGDDSIYNNGANVSISGGDGNDQIWNYNSNVTIDAGDGADTIISDHVNNVSINGGSGNDTITNWSGSTVLIDAGAGNDSIYNDGANVTINSGSGNDSITNWGETNVTIDLGAGNDTIFSSSENSSISGGAGEDTIRNYGSNVTLEGGAGDDVIYNNWNAEENRPYDDYYDGSNVVFKYTPGEGNDTIYGFNETSTLDLGGATYTLEENGDDVIITVGKGSILLRGAASLSAINIDGEEEILEPVWSVKGTTATFGTANSTKITITGLKSGLRAVDGYIDGIDVEDNVITLSANVLGTTTVKVTGDYYLAFGEDVYEPEEGDAVWKVNGTTATLSNSTTAGYTLSDDGQSITYTAAKAGAALVTITGLKSGLRAEDGYIDGIELVDDTIYLSANVLGTTTVKVSGDYVLALGDDVYPPEPTEPEWTISGTTATLRQTTTAGYTLSDDGQSITYTAAKAGAALITITGLKSSLRAEDGYIDGIELVDDTIYLSANVLGTTTVKVTGDYYLAFGEDVYEPEEGDAVWKVNGTTATLSQSTTAGYTLSDDGQSITYTAAKSGAALVTITGLKSGLKVDDGYIEGVELVDDTIYLSANVLGTTTVKVTGDYVLALGDDVYPPEPTEPEWTISGTTATLRQSTTAGYTLSDDAQSITYTAAQTGAALVTITGLKSGLTVDDDGYIDGVDFDGDNTIYLSANVLGTSTVKVTGDYVLAFGEDVYEPEEGDAEWTISGTTATLRQSTTAGYTLSDDAQSITYTAAQTGAAIVTITGLKSGLKVDDDGYIDGVDFDGDNTIYLSANVLGTSTVKVSGDYYLAFGDDVPWPVEGDAEWTISGTTATLSQSTTEGYILSNDEKSITYIAAKAGKAIATVSGLAKGLTAEDGYIDGIDVEDNVITLSADVLGTTKVTVKGDYTLALGDDVSEPEEVEDAWTIKGTTATLSDGTTAGYTLSNDERTITYSAAKAGKAKATITGLAKGLTANVDGTVDGIEFDGETITLSADVLGTSKVTLKGNDYALELGDDVERAEPSEEPEWKVSGTKATLNVTTSAGYVLSDDEHTVTYNAKEKTAAVATVSGLAKGLSADDLDSAIIVEDNVITLSADVLGTTKITVKEKGYTLALDDDYEPTEVEDAWIIKGTTATLSDGTTAGYTLSNDERSITYTAAKAGKAKATITGLAKGLTANVDGTVDGIEFDGETITLYADALGTSKITLKGTGYTLALGDDVEISEQAEEPEWKVSGTKATLNITTSAGYACDGQTITYSKKETTSAVATITGLKKGTTADDLDAAVTVEDNVITLSADVLGTTKITVKGDGYALALGDVDPVVYDDYDWTFNAKKQTATLKGNATAGYSCDGSTITYTAAKKNVTIATVTGVTDENGLDFDGETVTLSGDSLTDNVTVSGNVAFEFGDDFNDGTITGSKAADIITVNGTGVTINAGKGNDLLTTAGGNTFFYASGDGDDVIANFTEDDRIKVTSGTAKVTADDSDVKVTVSKGTITLSEAAGQTVYLLDKKDNETEHNPYWFIDDDFTTTPQLADITATTDCMLGEMDIATDPTQLVQTTPIVTASTKK